MGQINSEQNKAETKSSRKKQYINIDSSESNKKLLKYIFI